jgi:ATP-dependent Lhr-like helicase
VTGIDEYLRLILVIPSKIWRKPKFEGAGGELHTVVVQKMREILAGESRCRYLSPQALELLSFARTAFWERNLGKSGFLIQDDTILWYPWVGTKTLRTLALLARADQIKVEVDTFSLTYQSMTPVLFERHMEKVLNDRISSEQLGVLIDTPHRDRFDEYIDINLLRSAYLLEMIDLDAAKAAFGQWKDCPRHP